MCPARAPHRVTFIAASSPYYNAAITALSRMDMVQAPYAGYCVITIGGHLLFGVGTPYRRSSLGSVPGVSL